MYKYICIKATKINKTGVRRRREGKGGWVKVHKHNPSAPETHSD